MKSSLPDQRPPGAQGYFINTRRDKFKDPRVREALDLVFDFQWSNKKLFYGLYKRTDELLRKFGHEGDRASQAPKSWRCWSPTRINFRPRCSANPIRRR